MKTCENCKKQFTSKNPYAPGRFCSNPCKAIGVLTPEVRTAISNHMKGNTLAKGRTQTPAEIAHRLESIQHNPTYKRRLEQQGRALGLSNRGHKTPLSTRRKQSLSHRRRVEAGLHWNYRGYSKLVSLIRGCAEYRIWREHVFQRDNYTCQDCDAHTFKGLGHTIKLNADHIVPVAIIIPTYNIQTLTQALACGFLWDIRNGRTLCEPCHRKTPTYGRVTSYRAKNP